EGDAAGPLTLRLGPAGSVTGHLIDGRTQAAFARKTVMALFADPKLAEARGTRIPATAGTDGEGRFRLDGLVPGVNYDLFLSEPEKAVLHRAGQVTVSAGETKDLGDVPVKLTPVP